MQRTGLVPNVLMPYGRVARSAEVVDVEVADRDDADDESDEAEATEEPVDSVFDGPQKRDMYKIRFRGKLYTIFKTRGRLGNFDTFIRRDKYKGEVVERGLWNQHWSQPMKDFNENKKEYWRRYWKWGRKLKRIHGGGEKWPNGRPIYIDKMRRHQFTKIAFPQFAKPCEWKFSPKEVERRAQRRRALELQRRLAQEAELRRLARLRELGVWPGEEQWRRPWRPDRVNKETRIW